MRVYSVYGGRRNPDGRRFPCAAYERAQIRFPSILLRSTIRSLIRDAADKFGSQCVVVAIDAKRREDGSGWNIYKNGGRIDMGIDAVEWATEGRELWVPGKSS